ncbi:hypothetical protein ACHAXA_006523 [Cyclostephanos tholiformis]|uniref:Nudix hydrolase domain-containing protein n=1 Tax=Cyclostephanos tholiformis TaxID=382380 RepID=A0ABD3R6I5_9STRA
MTSILPRRLNQAARRTLLGGHHIAAAASRRDIVVVSSTISASFPNRSPPDAIGSPPAMTNDNSRRTLSSAAAADTSSSKMTKATTVGTIPPPPSSYQARKDAAKQKRRETYERTQNRLLRLSTRRDHSPKDVLRTKFRQWWDGEMQYHDHLLRMAKRDRRPWRIRVAVMVERIPVVIPDMEAWEREYVDLRDWLWTYGKEYPEETGFMYAPDKPEDHVVPTDEELLAGLPFTPAPRETEADATGDVRTRNRKLKTSVFLAIRSNVEGNASGPRWTLPSAFASTSDDETLLDTAKRAVVETAGSELKLWCPGNAPMAVNLRVYNNNLPAEFRGDYYGEKVFYYRVQHDSGDVNAETIVRTGGGVDDWGWLSKEEIVDRVKGERGKHQAKFFHYML